MQTLWQDLRYGARVLLKRPGFTLIAVMTLALGIGANTAIFTLFESQLRPLPVRDPESVVHISYRAANKLDTFTVPDYEYVRDHAHVYSGVFAFSYETFVIEGDQNGSEPQRLRGEFVSDNYFSVLGANVILGRCFTAEENSVPGRDPVVVLNHRFWQRQFASDPNIIGKALKLSGAEFTIIGVTESSFVGLASPDPTIPSFWLPLKMRGGVAARYQIEPKDGDWFGSRQTHWISVGARLKPGRSLEEARAEQIILLSQVQSAFPEINPKDTVRVTAATRLGDQAVSYRQLMLLVMGATCLVLLIACANVANLLLARAASRQKEIGVRLTLGATRWRVARQLLTESLLLAELGGAVGLLLSWWTIDLLSARASRHFSFPDPASMAISLDPDLRVLGFAFLVTVFSGIAFGLSPALRATGPDLMTTMKDGGTAFGQRMGQSWLRSGLVVAQVTLCLVLLIGAGLLLRGLNRALTTNTGYDAARVLSIYSDLNAARYDAVRAKEYQQALMTRLSSMPGVERVSIGESPLSGSWAGSAVLQSASGESKTRFDRVLYRKVSTGYLETLGIPIVRGRGFTRDESRADGESVVLSESTARNFWPNENPIGKVIRLEPNAKAQGLGEVVLPEARVIGIARDAQTERRFGQVPPYYIYVLMKPGEMSGSLVVRTTGDSRKLKVAARAAAKVFDPTVRVVAASLEDDVAGSPRVTQTRAASELATLLGVLAMLLAVIGIYGVMSYAVTQRTKEIGIRVALGAQRGDVLRLVVMQGMRLVAIGLLIGLAVSLVLTKVMTSMLSSLLFGLSTFDPVTLLLVPACLALVALVACCLPARRAMKFDPLTALRRE